MCSTFNRTSSKYVK